MQLKLKEILGLLRIRRQTFRKMNDKYHKFTKVSYGVYEIDDKELSLIIKYYDAKKIRSC